jgi:hypothetical protein
MARNRMPVPIRGPGRSPGIPVGLFITRVLSRAYHLRDPAEPPCIDARMLKGGRSRASERTDLPISCRRAPNVLFSRVCECAERLGIRLRLSHDVPALANLSMHPNERTCRSCLRRGHSN